MSIAERSAMACRRRAWAPALALFLGVLGLFLPTVKNGFISHDDPDYVTRNIHVRSGLTWDNLRWAWSSTAASNWHPLTWVSHMADAQIYGLNAPGHHLTNALLHALNALLLFLVLRKMTAATWRSLLVAALFGCHPLHVESVAWIAERKDVLSTLFWMLTLWAYAEWARLKGGKRKEEGGNRNWVFYGLALLFFALGLMSKAMVVSLPLVLLLLDYWPLDLAQGRPLGRTGGSGRMEGNSARLKTAMRLVVEKIPFFVLAAADSVATVVAQKRGGAVRDLISVPFCLRVENGLISCCGYLGKVFYPTKLAVFYPYREAFSIVEIAAAIALLLGLSAAAFALRRKHPYVPVGWLWYLITLAPVIGLVQVGAQSMADRYMYIPSVGIFVILVWGARDLTAGWRHRAPVRGAATAAALLGCILLTSRQIAYWKDSESLFRHALAVTENNWLAHANLGSALASDPGRQPEAIAELEESLRLAPDFLAARYNLGLLRAGAGQWPQAIAQMEEALRLDPDSGEVRASLGGAYDHLGAILAGQGRMPEAIAQYEKALQLTPDDAAAQTNLGVALADGGRTAEALAHYELALQLDPLRPEIHNDYGNALIASGGTLKAIAEYGEALRLKPDYVDARVNLAMALMQTGQVARAADQLAAASRLLPDDVEIHRALGSALAQLGRTEDARREFETALRLKPDDAEARGDLGRLPPP